MWSSTTVDYMSKIVAGLCMSSWFYLRCLVLPFCVYHAWAQGKVQNLFEEEGVTLPIYCFLLSLLVVLHYYWLTLMFRMVLRSLAGGGVEDT